MSFPKIVLAQLLDLIRARLANGDPAPTDQEIMERFDLDTVQRAQSMLADLADRGDISINRKAEPRAITLGRAKPAPLPAVRPIRTITKLKPSEAETFDRIREIIARGKRAVAPEPEVVSPVPQVEAAVGEGERQEVAKPSVAAAPRSGPEPGVRQINIRVPGYAFSALVRMGGAERPPGAVARELLIAAIDNPAGPATQASTIATRLRIPAAVTALASRDSIPVLDLVSTLISRGLQTYGAMECPA